MDKVFDQRMKEDERARKFETGAKVLDTLADNLAVGCALVEVKEIAFSLHCLAEALRVSARSGHPISITVARQLPLLELTEAGKAAIKKAAKK